MSKQEPTPERSGTEGALTPAHGTPAAVRLRAGPQVLRLWALFLGGPVVWFGHFMLVYLVAEAGCTGGGPGLRAFDHPVPVLVTTVATVVAVAVCVAISVWGWRWWRAERQLVAQGRDPEEEAATRDDSHRTHTLVLAGFLLATFSVAAILYTAAPAFALWSC